MKIVAFLTLIHILVVSSGVESRRHNFRGIENNRDLKGMSKSGSKSGGSKSAGDATADGTNRVGDGADGGGGSGGSKSMKSGSRNTGAGNRVAPSCMFNVPPDCVTWPLDEAAVNRATGPGILGYTLSETVLNPEDGSIYRVYLPNEGTLLPLDQEDFLSDPNVNRVPMGGEEEVAGGGLMDPTPSVSTPSPGVNRIPGSFTVRTGSCSKNIPSIGDGLPENCIQGDDCISGNCAVSPQVVNGVCVAEVPDGWTLLPSMISCVNK